MKKKMSICFISKHLYPYFSNRNFKSAGGAERQQYILSQEFKKNGLDVSIIVDDYRQNKRENKQNIELIKSFYLFQNNKILKPIFDFILLFSAMKKVDSDFYYMRILHYHTAYAAFICKILNKNLIFSVSNDRITDMSVIKKINPLIRFIYKLGINKSDIIIVQSEFQKSNIKKYYNRDSIVIKNAYPLEHYKPQKTKPPIILWVGSMRELKRPELFLKLAKSFPDILFKMVGGPAENKLFFAKIKRESRKIKNLRFLDYVPPDIINKYYEEAYILINTSKQEGFPNTFLEAWSKSVPVISLNVNPDGCITRNELGFHSKTFDNMINDINLLLKDDSLRNRLGKNAREYVKREHDIKNIYRKYLKIFENLINH